MLFHAGGLQIEDWPSKAYQRQVGMHPSRIACGTHILPDC
jgi:hypothetical protein